MHALCVYANKRAVPLAEISYARDCMRRIVRRNSACVHTCAVCRRLEDEAKGRRRYNRSRSKGILDCVLVCSALQRTRHTNTKCVLVSCTHSSMRNNNNNYNLQFTVAERLVFRRDANIQRRSLCAICMKDIPSFVRESKFWFEMFVKYIRT